MLLHGLFTTFFTLVTFALFIFHWQSSLQQQQHFSLKLLIQKPSFDNVNAAFFVLDYSRMSVPSLYSSSILFKRLINQASVPCSIIEDEENPAEPFVYYSDVSASITNITACSKNKSHYKLSLQLQQLEHKIKVGKSMGIINTNDENISSSTAILVIATNTSVPISRAEVKQLNQIKQLFKCSKRKKSAFSSATINTICAKLVIISESDRGMDSSWEYVNYNFMFKSPFVHEWNTVLQTILFQQNNIIVEAYQLEKLNSFKFLFTVNSQLMNNAAATDIISNLRISLLFNDYFEPATAFFDKKQIAFHESSNATLELLPRVTSLLAHVPSTISLLFSDSSGFIHYYYQLHLRTEAFEFVLASLLQSAEQNVNIAVLGSRGAGKSNLILTLGNLFTGEYTKNMFIHVCASRLTNSPCTSSYERYKIFSASTSNTNSSGSRSSGSRDDYNYYDIDNSNNGTNATQYSIIAHDTIGFDEDISYSNQFLQHIFNGTVRNGERSMTSVHDSITNSNTKNHKNTRVKENVNVIIIVVKRSVCESNAKGKVSTECAKVYHLVEYIRQNSTL